MSKDLEALILSGEFFNPSSRSSSPIRSPDSDDDPGWHDSDLEDAIPVPDEPAHESIGMKPGRTGPKGVIADRDEAVSISREKKALEMDEMRSKFEKSNLGGKTYLEEQRELPADDNRLDLLVQQERDRDARKLGRDLHIGRFGHLREVGAGGFVAAVEAEDRNVWVVLHLYDSTLDRCYDLDEKLTRLARDFPETKFLRCRAGALGFTSGTPSQPAASSTIHRPPRQQQASDSDDEDSDNETASDQGETHEDDVDLDMLPTMLIYRGGELVHNWIRVDWEAGRAGVEDLLTRHRILPQTGTEIFADLSSDEDEPNELW